MRLVNIWGNVNETDRNIKEDKNKLNRNMSESKKMEKKLVKERGEF